MRGRFSVRCAALAAAVLLVLACAGSSAAENMPSLFRNDEVWYKDSIEPLRVRGDALYVPRDFFGMFPEISVSYPKDNNLLLWHLRTGNYVSLLLGDGSSAINGLIGDSVRTFRDENTWYVEAVPVCEALGLSWETFEDADGVLTLRVTDGNERLSMKQLSGIYGEEDDGTVSAYVDDGPAPAKVIYIWCTSPEDNTQYSIEAELERFGMACTVFLWEDADLPRILAGQSYGDYGVATADEVDTAGALRDAGERIYDLTGRRSRWTITTGDADTDAEMRKAGFCPLTPDFTVTSATELDTMMMSFEAMLSEKDRVSVFLTDSWKGTVAVSLIRALLDNHPDWQEVNLGAGK